MIRGTLPTCRYVAPHPTPTVLLRLGCRFPCQRYRYMRPCAPPQALDLIDRMLVFDPTKRITVEEALEHPYLASLHDVSDEPVCPTPFTFDFDADHLTPDVVRDVILQVGGCGRAGWELISTCGGGTHWWLRVCLYRMQEPLQSTASASPASCDLCIAVGDRNFSLRVPCRHTLQDMTDFHT